MGASWGLLGASWGNLRYLLGHAGVFWRVLGRLGDVLGWIFVPKETLIMAYHFGFHFLTDIRPNLLPKMNPSSLSSLGELSGRPLFFF